MNIGKKVITSACSLPLPSLIVAVPSGIRSPDEAGGSAHQAPPVGAIREPAHLALRPSRIARCALHPGYEAEQFASERLGRCVERRHDVLEAECDRVLDR